MDRVEGRWGGALPPTPPPPGDRPPGSSPAERDPYSCLISTSCLQEQKLSLHDCNLSFFFKKNKTKYFYDQYLIQSKDVRCFEEVSS